MKSANKLCQEVSSKLSMLDSKRKPINRCKGSKEIGKKNIGSHEMYVSKEKKMERLVI